jgi:hypothetical protein
MKMRGFVALAGAALFLLAVEANAAAYVLTSGSAGAPSQKSGAAYVDTVWATTNAVVDTLMFGFIAEEACVWTDAAETVGVKWVSFNAMKLYQTGGSTPPAAAAAKARYGALKFSSTSYTVPASTTYPTPFTAPLYSGVILTGTGSYTVNIAAVRK